MTTDARQILESLLAKGESETVEFKESFDDEALETIAAFANTRGGSLLVGIADNSAIRGVKRGKETLRDWANRIAQAVRVHPNIQRLSIEEKIVVLIQVNESAMKPLPCRGRYYKRVGASNRQLSEDDLTRAVLDKVGIT